MCLLVVLRICIFFSMTLTMTGAIDCSRVVQYCQQQDSNNNVPMCVEREMKHCARGRLQIQLPDFYIKNVDFSEAKLETTYGHVINIPQEALVKSGGTENISVSLIVSILNNNIFKAPSVQGSVHGSVLGVWLGAQDLHNLSQTIEMQFVNISQNVSGKCVFWKQSNNSGYWSSDGCTTNSNNKDFICNCNHLSFFAVLISPGSVQDPEDVRHLEYISYIGSSFSLIFTAIIIMLFFIKRKKKTEHSVIIHVQLSGSLFLLHLFFLASTLGSGTEKKPICQCLGLILHWALLTTFTWTAIEGFHLYLLLVRVFNIYIKRYLLKLSLVGWGAPLITVVICGLSGEYGKYTLTESNNETNLCWITNKIVSYITVNGYLGLVLLFNTAIMAVTVVKMWKLKLRGVQTGSRLRRLWKDWAILLGISVVLGLPWGLAFCTYGPLGLPGIYLFTIINAFQGFFVFLWYVSITCKPSYEERNSTKNLSMSNFSS
ncbi:adhesion G protein-coupled receptor G3 [Tachysurus fulvidraco]|uniref:adhesion G protein-coupled receptor G3 n=1 Tax=Tachysurus fulvidraco TaxID=1234273 RepID=UPI001FEE9E0F|nr:adhesion G protein-coupled receptor G3 [Tachysurus fulvidraco]